MEWRGSRMGSGVRERGTAAHRCLMTTAGLEKIHAFRLLRQVWPVGAEFCAAGNRGVADDTSRISRFGQGNRGDAL